MEPDPKVLNNGGGVTLIANWVEGTFAASEFHPRFTQGNAQEAALFSRQGRLSSSLSPGLALVSPCSRRCGSWP